MNYFEISIPKDKEKKVELYLNVLKKYVSENDKYSDPEYIRNALLELIKRDKFFDVIFNIRQKEDFKIRGQKSPKYRSLFKTLSYEQMLSISIEEFDNLYLESKKQKYNETPIRFVDGLRYETYPKNFGIDEVFEIFDTYPTIEIEKLKPIFQKKKYFGHKEYIQYDGYLINKNSLRYVCFRKLRTCSNCGLAATHFLLQRSTAIDSDKWHFNLYAKLPNGLLELFTKDHIIPVSKGGLNNPENLVTMCEKCNTLKGNSII